MPPSKSHRRSRLPKRRFSSVDIIPWDGSYLPVTSASTPVYRGPRRRPSSPSISDLAPFYNQTSGSEYEASNRPALLGSDCESIISQDHNFAEFDRPLIYASLPPSPTGANSPTSSTSHIVSPEPLSPTFPPSPTLSQAPFSLWDYLREELLATDFDSHQELKWERVSNFLSIPLAMEKVRIDSM
jgi:hypothetical protein